MAEPPAIRSSPQTLRQIFNDGDFHGRVLRGELAAFVLKDRHPSLPAAHEPFCTRSQLVAYFDAVGTKIAVVHQYLRADGSLGASGRPDPKRLLVDGTIFYA